MTNLIQSLYVAAESTHETDPSADGSGYRFTAHNAIVALNNGREQLPTNHQVESGLPTIPQRGPSAWTLEFSIMCRGLAAAAGDGVSPVVADADDLLLTNAFGSTSDRDGVGVDAGSAGTSLVLESGSNAVDYDLIPVYEAGLATTRTQWAAVTDDSSDPTLAVYPNFTTAGTNPTTAAIAYGCRHYRFLNSYTGSLAFYGRHGSHYYSLLGGKVTGLRQSLPNRGIATWTFQVSGSLWQRLGSAKASAPAATAPTLGGVVGVNGAFFWNGSAYSISSAQIDYGLNAILRAGQDGANGYTAGRNITARPTIQIDPLYATGLEDAYDDPQGTNGAMLYQLGAGVLSGGVLNTCALHIDTAWVSQHQQQDRQGERGSQITLSAAHANPGATQFQFARA